MLLSEHFCKITVLSRIFHSNFAAQPLCARYPYLFVQVRGVCRARRSTAWRANKIHNFPPNFGRRKKGARSERRKTGASRPGNPPRQEPRKFPSPVRETTPFRVSPNARSANVTFLYVRAYRSKKGWIYSRDPTWNRSRKVAERMRKERISRYCSSIIYGVRCSRSSDLCRSRDARDAKIEKYFIQQNK